MWWHAYLRDTGTDAADKTQTDATEANVTVVHDSAAATECRPLHPPGAAAAVRAAPPRQRRRLHHPSTACAARPTPPSPSPPATAPPAWTPRCRPTSPPGPSKPLTTPVAPLPASLLSGSCPCPPSPPPPAGSTANLELAWRLVRPCLCPELPLRHYTSLIPERADAGVAAVRAGRLDMVVWLVERRCRPLVPARADRAAAVHCSLAGLQEVWGALLRLDPGLAAEAWENWQEVRRAADNGLLVGSSGAWSIGGCGCEEVQSKGAWLYARYQELEGMSRHQQEPLQWLPLKFEWRWWRRPGSASAAGGSGCSKCRCHSWFQVCERMTHFRPAC